MRTLLTFTLFLSIALCTPLPLHAQEVESVRDHPAYGGFAHLNLNTHTADFRALPGTPSCCPLYESGDGTGFSFGLLYELPLAERLRLALRVAYADHSATLETDEATLVSGPTGPVAGIIRHSIDASVASLGLEPLLGYRLWKGLSFWGGFHAGYLMQTTYEQQEQLVEPADMGTFENGLRTRNPQSGDIPDASSLHSGLLAGVSYSLPLNETGTLSLVPEIFYSYAITDVITDLDWRANALRAGLALKYAPLPRVPQELPPPPRDVVPDKPRVPRITATVYAKAVTHGGREYDIATIVVEEISEVKQRPLLNYIFFKDGSSALEERYRRLGSEQTEAFAINDLHHDETLDMYYHILNIVGKRMRENPETMLRIVGCNSNTGLEQGDTDLSRDRAETVKDYLVSVWEIDADRLDMTARDLPSTPSSGSEEDGIYENRRVELYSDSWDILKPITTKDIRRIATPPIVRFYPRVHAEKDVYDWLLPVKQDGQDVIIFNDHGIPPSSIEWAIAADQRQVPQQPGEISFILHASDEVGTAAVSEKGILPVEVVTLKDKRARQVVDDMEIREYSLILFDFDKSTLNEQNRRIVRGIRSEIAAASEVTITGYTDRVGDVLHNDRLSRERAHSAARALGKEDAQISGLGESVELHDNDVPEGRFYSRTVDIRARIPLR